MLSHLIRLIRSWRRYDASLRELSRLGDRELADIGVLRSDIPRIARDAAERSEEGGTEAGDESQDSLAPATAETSEAADRSGPPFPEASG